MLFGSWTHTSDEIDVDFIFPGGLDLSTFQRDFKVELSDRIVFCIWRDQNVIYLFLVHIIVFDKLRYILPHLANHSIGRPPPLRAQKFPCSINGDIIYHSCEGHLLFMAKYLSK